MEIFIMPLNETIFSLVVKSNPIIVPLLYLFLLAGIGISKLRIKLFLSCPIDISIFLILPCIAALF
jgi:hypothetical protein